MAHIADSWEQHIQSLGQWLRCLLWAHDSLLLGISRPNDRLRIVGPIWVLVCAWNGGQWDLSRLGGAVHREVFGITESPTWGCGANLSGAPRVLRWSRRAGNLVRDVTYPRLLEQGSGLAKRIIGAEPDHRSLNSSRWDPHYRFGSRVGDCHGGGGWGPHDRRLQRRRNSGRAITINRPPWCDSSNDGRSC